MGENVNMYVGFGSDVGEMYFDVRWMYVKRIFPKGHLSTKNKGLFHLYPHVSPGHTSNVLSDAREGTYIARKSYFRIIIPHVALRASYALLEANQEVSQFNAHR